MCGIAGYIGRGLVSEANRNNCFEEMKKRGPDSSGYFFEKTNENLNVQILHSRLRIIDQNKKSNQPFIYKKNCLSFNGEIYNYIELKDKLKKEGEIFITNGDTEILATVLAKYGMDGLNLCEGMWALAWLSDGKLHLARDRFGEKPLFYFKNYDGVYFGSEPKFIFKLLGKNLNLNKTQLLRYLVNGYKSLNKSKETFFLGLMQVPPGSIIEINRGGISKPIKYWTPKFDIQNNQLAFIDVVENTRYLLNKAVKLRLRSDLPIAFCLSGGVDSNAIASIAKKEFNYDVHGFTIVNTDSRYEESEMIATSINTLNIKHTKVYPTRDNFLENLRHIINYHDSPISTISYYAHWQLMEKISDNGFKVSISGTGADELFSGYFDHHNFYLSSIAENTDMYKIALDNWKKLVFPIVRNPYLKDPECFIKNIKSRDHIFLDSNLFSSYMVDGWREAFDEVVFTGDTLRNRMLNELFHESVPVILHEDDLNSMYFSIENRSPFLDTELFNFTQTIPTKFLIQEGRAKAILRESLRGIVSDLILDNPVKVGFNAPLLDYINFKDTFVRNKLLEDSPIFKIVKRDSIENLMNKSFLKNSESKFLFNFINSKIFLELYL